MRVSESTVHKLDVTYRTAKLAFARLHQKCTTVWSRVLFSNESRFCVNIVDGVEAQL